MIDTIVAVWLGGIVLFAVLGRFRGQAGIALWLMLILNIVGGSAILTNAITGPTTLGYVGVVVGLVGLSAIALTKMEE